MNGFASLQVREFVIFKRLKKYRVDRQQSCRSVKGEIIFGSLILTVWRSKIKLLFVELTASFFKPGVQMFTLFIVGQFRVAQRPI